MITITASPAAAVSRDSIVSIAQGQLGNSSRNHEQPMGSGCNYYTGYFRSWKPSAGCPSTDGVQWRDSDWCADFSKYVWKNAGVRYARRRRDRRRRADRVGGLVQGLRDEVRNMAYPVERLHAAAR